MGILIGDMGAPPIAPPPAPPAPKVYSAAFFTVPAYVAPDVTALPSDLNLNTADGLTAAISLLMQKVAVTPPNDPNYVKLMTKVSQLSQAQAALRVSPAIKSAMPVSATAAAPSSNKGLLIGGGVLAAAVIGWLVLK